MKGQLLRSYSINITDKMKKLKFCIPLLLFISCENFETSPEYIDPQSQHLLYEIEELKSIYANSIDIALDAFDGKKSKTKQYDPYLAQKELIMEMAEVVSKELINFENGGEQKFLDEFENIIPSNNTQARMQKDMLNVSSVFTVQQTKILNPFIDALELTGNPQQSKNIAHSFQNQLINSSTFTL